MRAFRTFCAAAAAAALAGCIARAPPTDPLAAEVYAQGVAGSVAAKAVTTAASVDPSGMAAGPADAISRGIIHANSARINASVQSRLMAQEAAIAQCFAESKKLSGGAADTYVRACAARARGIN